MMARLVKKPSHSYGLESSTALKANLQETAVDEIQINPRFFILREPVNAYGGILKTLNKLLYELHHPYRNWRLILPELRSFVLKNTSRYINHPKGPDCTYLFVSLFLEALADEGKQFSTEEAAELIGAYLDRLVNQLSSTQLLDYGDTITAIFKEFAKLPDEKQLVLVRIHYPLRRTLNDLLAKSDNSAPDKVNIDWKVLGDFIYQLLDCTYRYWLTQNDPISYYHQGMPTLDAISHQTIRTHLKELKTLQAEGLDFFKRSEYLPSYMDIVKAYQRIGEKINKQEVSQATSGEAQNGENLKLTYLFRIMETEGLLMLHESTLKEINRALVQMVRRQNYEEIEDFFLKTFQLLKDNVGKYPETALQLIKTLGIEIYKRNNSRMVEAFLAQAVRFGFQYSRVSGFTRDWQPIDNPAHIVNIRIWLSLIKQNPEWFCTLLSALIINLKLTGTCIRDTDLFQKEVTLLLNSKLCPVYNLVKQFAKLLPVYYNDIGAEGLLREVSTELDESTQRQDHLVHFLRKQCHVESNNRIVDFMRAIFAFWHTADKACIADFVPPEVLTQIDPTGIYVESVHSITKALFATQDINNEEELLQYPLAEIEQVIQGLSNYPTQEKRRVFLMIRMYHLLNLKYNLGFQELEEQLMAAKNIGLPDMQPVLDGLQPDNPSHSLEILLSAMEKLQKVILSTEIFDMSEDILQKRHVTTDIPSVYGYYQERKFDALSLSFRLENMANVYLEKLIEELNPGLLTRGNLHKVIKALKLFLRILAISGIASRRFIHLIDVLERSLEVKGFCYRQYIDLFRNMSEALKDIIYTYYTNYHRDNLAIIVPSLDKKTLLSRYVPQLDGSPSGSLSRISESFERELIAETPGLQAMDNYITRAYQILSDQGTRLQGTALDLLMLYDPDKVFCALYEPNPLNNDPIHLGNKGFHLTHLIKNDVNVPPGVVLTTEFFRYEKVVRGYSPAWRDFVEKLHQQLAIIEEKTGRQFGSTENPLLLSVRSGALVSMPGMMSTIHNLGLNPDIVQGLAKQTGSAKFAWDTYRRFIHSWGMAVGIDRELFHNLMLDAKERYGITKKNEFTAKQTKKLAFAYRRVVEEQGVSVPEDPLMQLLDAIGYILDSWNDKKAVEFRRLLDISDAWGTSVLLQAMVFGNLNQESGTGVVFTSYPRRNLSRVTLWGDYTPGNQGEDIVGGVISTLPISIEQSELDGRSKAQSLEVCFPEIYQSLLKISRHLIYEKHWNNQEIEFTFEGSSADSLSLLQTREMVTAKQKNVPMFSQTPALSQSILGRGMGVYGGALCGQAVFNRAHIDQVRKQHPDMPLILIRSDTVPDDISEISATEGLLTARGGQTSHASIVTIRLEKTCVVGCEAMVVSEAEGRCTFNNTVINVGDDISIDGRTGLILKGHHPIEQIETE
ncbi:PEP/pyruvate-binding domain-containing protein [Candidatus Parabeggiatoa sp. HSG14]|uniref:PEP/pyruvate-binding domain-containing protein n=1 Tax=Candidatus Parabeggiatoa sp. HSG14 TaxID=3055593 RepID=UPI0025A87B59|nr:PEP/pyruvate-binding domain-containing protein [Thiotrichales bacterium HSG14]